MVGLKVVEGKSQPISSEVKSATMKGKGQEDEDESDSQYGSDGMNDYIDFLSRRFSKLKFKRNPNLSKHGSQNKKGYQQNKDYVAK